MVFATFTTMIGHEGDMTEYSKEEDFEQEVKVGTTNKKNGDMEDGFISRWVHAKPNFALKDVQQFRDFFLTSTVYPASNQHTFA